MLRQIDEQDIRIAKAQLALKIIKLTFELIGFGVSLAATVLCISSGNEAWYVRLLAGVAGFLTGVFAHRYTLGMFNAMLDLAVAAQKGTILAILAQKGLDNWDCGDPSCEGCKKAREEREAAKNA